MSETKKHRHLTVKYCVGNGIDLGAGGDVITPRALSIDLSQPYTSVGTSINQWSGDAANLYWFKDNVLDYVYSSHLIEDFTAEQQTRVFKEWCRVIKPMGHLVILAPEKHRWKAALGRGQGPNYNHKNEPELGEFTRLINEKIGGWSVCEDKFCEPDNELEYGMIFVARKNI